MDRRDSVCSCGGGGGGHTHTHTRGPPPISPSQRLQSSLTAPLVGHSHPSSVELSDATWTNRSQGDVENKTRIPKRFREVHPTLSTSQTKTV
ncbi:Protein of unknown function [Gryllus bimaculatus]|nr:Protein of unknown function [Gryllus bimaculatus]